MERFPACGRDASTGQPPALARPIFLWYTGSVKSFQPQEEKIREHRQPELCRKCKCQPRARGQPRGGACGRPMNVTRRDFLKVGTVGWVAATVFGFDLTPA